jgi:stage III sporulation protein AD
MFQICVLSIAGIFASLVIRKDKPEYSSLIILLVSFFIAIRIIAVLGNAVSQISGWQKLLGDNASYITMLLKLIGITYICDFAASLCRDFGYSALGSHIELFGKVAVMVAGFPVIKIMIEMMESVM